MRAFGGRAPVLSLMGNQEAEDRVHHDIILNCPQGLPTQKRRDASVCYVDGDLITTEY